MTPLQWSSQVLGCLIVLLARFVSFSVPDLCFFFFDLNSSGRPGTCVSRYWTGNDSVQETLLDAIDTVELCASIPNKNSRGLRGPGTLFISMCPFKLDVTARGPQWKKYIRKFIFIVYYVPSRTPQRPGLYAMYQYVPRNLETVRPVLSRGVTTKKEEPCIDIPHAISLIGGFTFVVYLRPLRASRANKWVNVSCFMTRAETILSQVISIYERHQWRRGYSVHDMRHVTMFKCVQTGTWRCGVKLGSPALRVGCSLSGGPHDSRIHLCIILPKSTHEA